MGTHFCKHGFMRDCPKGCVDVTPGNMATVSGDNVPKLGVQSLVPKGRKDKDVKYMINQNTGHMDKHYYNWGLGEWHPDVKSTRASLRAKDLVAGEDHFA